MRVSYETMYQEFVRVLLKHGFTKKKTELPTRLYVDASRDGVYTHGLNCPPKFMASIDNGCVDTQAEPVQKESFGLFERYDGRWGPGNLNAYTCMERATRLAKENATGCAALPNANHWMRPGNYGLMVARESCIGILWTSTVPNMSPWGGRDARLGNDSVVFAIPHGDTSVLVNVAMSMFSYGKLESYAHMGKELPVDGGYNREQQITKNAAETLGTHRCIPIGYWKDSGLSLVLNLIAVTPAGGCTSRMVGEPPGETTLSQAFIAISLDSFRDKEALLVNIHATLQDMRMSTPVAEGHPVHYPGENMIRTRKENMGKGAPVDEGVWQKILETQENRKKLEYREVLSIDRE